MANALGSFGLPALLVELLAIPGFWTTIGLCVGSFLTVVVWRLPIMIKAHRAGADAGMTLSYPASKCSCCGQKIRWYENLPLVGFALLRGKTRCCRQVLHVRYLALELGGGLWASAMWFCFAGKPLQMIALSVFGWSSMALLWMALFSKIRPFRVIAIAVISLLMGVYAR